jgi:hypothetical protein
MKSPLLFSFSLLLVAALGCEDTGVVRRDDGGTGPVDAPAGTDGGAPTTLSYTPAGCDYQVVTPASTQVREAAMGGTVLGATPTPGFIHASWAGPTQTTFAINWRTDDDTTYSQLLYGIDRTAVEGADGATADVTLVEGHHVLFETLLEDLVRLHEAHVCGLSPSTVYYYKVGGPGTNGWSEVFEIATGPTVGATEAFRFAVTGDSRNDSMIWAETQRAIETYDVDFQVFSGDAVVLGVNQPEWDGFFGHVEGDFSVVDVLAQIPLMPANGNHDGLALNYVLQFAVPQDPSTGERAEGEEWYSFDYGNAHFVVLNDTAGDTLVQGDQRDWLRRDLMAVDRGTTPWVFAVHHKPPYSCSTNHGSDVSLRNAWQPLYDEFGVDVVFNGHDHDYERSLPIRGIREGTSDGVIAESGTQGQPVDGSGTVYVVAAGAGAPLYGVSDTCYHTHFTESTRNYLILEVEGTTLRYTAYRLDGTVLDEFTYTK